MIPQLSSYQTRLGVFYMATAIFMFATVNAVVKDVVSLYPVMQVIFFRFLFALLPCSFMVYKSGGLASLKTPNLKSHLFCGGLAVLNLVLLFSTFKIVPLADVTAFAFSTILFVTLLSYPLLGEVVGLYRWFAVLLGFLGVLIMANPSGNLFHIGALMALIFAFGDALMMIFARLLARTDKSSSIVFYCSLFAMILSGSFAMFSWVWPSFTDFLKLFFLGVGSGVAQLLLTFAYRHAQAALIAPVIYTAILWSTFYGYYFWGEIPSKEALLGGSLVIISGLALIYGEKKKAKILEEVSPSLLSENQKKLDTLEKPLT